MGGATIVILDSYFLNSLPISPKELVEPLTENQNSNSSNSSSENMISSNEGNGEENGSLLNLGKKINEHIKNVLVKKNTENTEILGCQTANEYIHSNERYLYDSSIEFGINSK